MKKYYMVSGFEFKYLDDAIRESRNVGSGIIYYFNGETIEKIFT